MSRISIKIGGGTGGNLVILFFIFMVLKLTGHIAWSWLWVTAPLWAPIGLVLGIALIGLMLGGLVLGVMTICERGSRKRRRRRAGGIPDIRRWR